MDKALVRVIIVDTDVPSIIYTDDDCFQVTEAEGEQELRVVVRRTVDSVVLISEMVRARRKDGLGAVSCKYITEDGSAVEGHHYERLEGEISFPQEENSAEIVVKILESSSGSLLDRAAMNACECRGCQLKEDLWQASF